MAAEEIVTKFTADLSDLQAGIATATGQLKKYEDLSGGVAKSGEQLGATIGSLTAKTVALDAVQKKSAASAREQSASLAALAKGAKDANVAAGQLSSTLPGAIADLRDEALSALESLGGITAEQKNILAGAVNILAEYESIRATGEQFPGQLAGLREQAAQTLTALTGVSAEEIKALQAAAKLTEETERTADKASATPKRIETLRVQLRKAEQDAVRLAAELGASSPQAIRAAEAAAKLRDEIADGKALIDAFNPEAKFQVLTQLAGNAAGGLTAVQGALTAVGIGGDGAAEALAKVQGLLAVTQGLNAFAGIGDSLKNFTALLKASQVAQVASTAVTEADTVAKGANTAATTGAAASTTGLTGAVRGLTATIAANPLGALVVGLVAVAALFVACASDAKDLGEQIKQLKSDIDELASLDSKSFGLRQQLEEAKIEQRLLRGEITKTQAEQEKGQVRLRNLQAERAFAEQDLIKANAALRQAETGNDAEAYKEASKLAFDQAERLKNLDKALVIAKIESENAVTALSQQEEQKRTDEAKKRSEERIRQTKEESDKKKAIEAQRTDLQRGINDQIKALEDARIREGLSARDKEAFDIDSKYDGLVAKAQEAFSKLRKLAGEGTPGADTAALENLAAQEKAATAQINAARDSEQQAATARATANEIKTRQEGQAAVIDAVRSGNATQLDLLRSRIQAGQRLTTQERDLYLSLVQAQADAEVAIATEKYAKLLEENRKYNSDAGGLTEEGAKNEKALLAAKEAEITSATQGANQQRTDLLTANQQANIGLLSDFGDQALSVLAQAAASGTLTAEEVSKQLILLALDTIEKMVLLNAINAQTGAIAFGTATAGPAGTVQGIIQGAIVSALIKGLFTAVKAQIQGAYTGESYISGTPMWSGKDGHLRRVHTGERIVTARTNDRHFDLFEAAEKGALDDYLSARYVLPALNRYLDSDEGRRHATSVMLAPYYDKNIVDALKGTKTEQAKTNELLGAMLRQRTRVITPNRRAWN